MPFSKLKFLRIRFSIRTLIIASALVGVVSFWLTAPYINAHKFASALNERDFETAEQLFTSDEEFPQSLTKEHIALDAHVVRGLFAEFVMGRRYIDVRIIVGEEKYVKGGYVGFYATPFGVTP